MKKELEKEIMEITYTEIKPTLQKIVGAFKRKYGGEYDVLYSEACFHYIDLYNEYDPLICPYKSFLHWFLWKRLLNFIRNQRRHNHLSLINQYSFIKTTPFFELIDDLKQDSKNIIQLIFDPPQEIIEEHTKKGGQPRNFRSALKNHLLYKLNWTAKRVKESFDEIKKAL